MCNNFKIIGIAAAALGLGIILASVFPASLLIWVLGVVIVAVGIACIL